MVGRHALACIHPARGRGCVSCHARGDTIQADAWGWKKLSPPRLLNKARLPSLLKLRRDRSDARPDKTRVPARGARQILSRPAAFTFSSPRRKPWGSPRPIRLGTQPRLARGGYTPRVDSDAPHRALTPSGQTAWRFVQSALPPSAALHLSERFFSATQWGASIFTNSPFLYEPASCVAEMQPLGHV